MVFDARFGVDLIRISQGDCIFDLNGTAYQHLGHQAIRPANLGRRATLYVPELALVWDCKERQVVDDLLSPTGSVDGLRYMPTYP